MVWPTAQSGLHGFPRSCFCFCHIRDSSSWTTCSRGAWFRKTTGARKPMSVSRCRLHFDRFRWAKHETRVDECQSSVDRCIARPVKGIFSIFDGFVPPLLTPEQAVLASGAVLPGLCYDVVRRRWFWADADILEEQREQIPFTRACYKAARLLVKDLQGYGRRTASLSSGKNGSLFGRN